MARGMHGRRACMVGGMHGGGHAWWGACMAGRGACMAGGTCMAGGMCGRGACMAGGVHGRGRAWQVCVADSTIYGQ